MQNINSKKTHFLLIFFILFFKVANCQNFTDKINFADSLYKEKKYTESLKMYENLFISEKKASKQMLLKMARINEGSKNYPNALYYLSLYYTYFKDEIVIPKTLNIAKNNNYKGWDYDDLNYIENVFSKNKKLIITFLFSLLLILTFILLYRKYKKQAYPVLFIVIVFISISIISIINIAKEKKYAVILQDNSLVMDAPSAGANLIEVSTNGHKIEVLNSTDIWTKVKINNEVGFIRTTNLIIF